MKSALLIIDVQRALFEPAPFEAAAVIERINQLRARARAAKAPVVFIQHETASSPLVYDSQGWQLHTGLEVTESDVRLRKTTPDSFLRTPLHEMLTAWGIEQLVMCGYATEFCVDTSARRAAALGYPVLLAADAHTTHDKPHASAQQIRQHHNATLSDISSFGPRISALAAAEISFAT